MDAENQHRAIHEKFSAMLNGFKKLLAKKREGGVIPPKEATSKAKTELLKSIRLSEIEIGRILQEARETAKISLDCLLYTSPSPRDKRQSRMPSSA